jgi:hypothetical protein
MCYREIGVGVPCSSYPHPSLPCSSSTASIIPPPFTNRYQGLLGLTGALLYSKLVHCDLRVFLTSLLFLSIIIIITCGCDYLILCFRPSPCQGPIDTLSMKSRFRWLIQCTSILSFAMAFSYFLFCHSSSLLSIISNNFPPNAGRFFSFLSVFYHYQSRW